MARRTFLVLDDPRERLDVVVHSRTDSPPLRAVTRVVDAERTGDTEAAPVSLERIGHADFVPHATDGQRKRPPDAELAQRVGHPGGRPRLLVHGGVFVATQAPIEDELEPRGDGHREAEATTVQHPPLAREPGGEEVEVEQPVLARLALFALRVAPFHETHRLLLEEELHVHAPVLRVGTASRGAPLVADRLHDRGADLEPRGIHLEGGHQPREETLRTRAGEPLHDERRPLARFRHAHPVLRRVRAIRIVTGVDAVGHGLDVELARLADGAGTVRHPPQRG